MASLLNGAVVTATTRDGDRPLRFFVQDPADAIQKHHIAGRFYEEEELAIIARHLIRHGIYLDVGANVGNHIVYLAMKGVVGPIIAIEPNPPAIEILRINLLLNDLSSAVDLRHLGLGLSDREEMAAARNPHVNNLGGTKMVEDAAGTIRLVAGDTLFAARRIDFIKIDVEGQEIKVLAGLAKTIAANRPVMFVEVDNANRAAFDLWCTGAGYTVAERYKRYRENENFLIRPR